MKPLLFLALCAIAHAAPPASFFRALHQVETSGRIGAILGDNGRALGPLQIHEDYWLEVAHIVKGKYEDCAGLKYSQRVVAAYLKRHAPLAWAKGDVTTLAKVHNGGPKGASKPATIAYAKRVQRAMR